MEFENELMAQRHANRLELENLGIDPYPGKCERSHKIAELHATYDEHSREQLEAEPVQVSITGRMMLNRPMGKAAFATLKDGTGQIQVYIRQDTVSASDYRVYELTDLGDFAGVSGTLFRTKTGELSVKAAKYQFLAKAYRGLPEKFHGLKDMETRYRQRYLDLIANPEVKSTFVKRSRIISAIREFMDSRDYLEVETPMMHLIPGGATARPFVTHHNALNLNLFMRIALELPLKRLIVGGLERVYEINRNFRNEGIDASHNPEFTMMEWYESYANLDVMMEMVESMLRQVAARVHGPEPVSYGEHQLDFQAPFRKMTLKEAIHHYGGFPLEALDELPSLFEIAKKLHLEGAEKMEYGKLLTEVFELVAESKLIQPTFITEYPVSVSPLTKKKPGVPGFVERFELFIAGMELANAYTELNDPIDQRERFMDQLRQREAGDDEAQLLDEDFLIAMEHGMPPTGGQGLGIDRLVMLLTNSSSIRDVLLFPLMRPHQ